MVDDKPQLLAAMKRVLGAAPDDGVRASGPLRGRSRARSRSIPRRIVAIERIGDLRRSRLAGLLVAARAAAATDQERA